MRLLFDQNLSHRLLTVLGDVFPDSFHVRLLGMAEAVDRIRILDHPDSEVEVVEIW